MKWGLVLSGGAAYGLANAGVLLQLEQEGYRPDYIAGSSMGAIVAALYAYKGLAAELEHLCDSLTLKNVARFSDAPLKDGLHGGLLQQDLKQHLEHIIGDALIGDCIIPFVCVAGRVREPIDWKKIMLPGFATYVMSKVEPVVFPKDTRIVDAIMASSAIPVIFSPVHIGSSSYVDLVHFGAIPARTLRHIHSPDIVIGTNTTPVYTTLMRFLPRSWSEFLERGYEELEKSMAACDLVITPTMTSSPIRFDKARMFVESGRTATQDAMPRIRELLG